MILIQKQWITNENSLYRLNTTIVENGVEKNLYVEVEEEYSKYLTQEVADAVMYLVLPVALREGYDIYSKIPVSEEFLHNIKEFLIPHLVKGDNTLSNIQIHATGINFRTDGEGVGTAISCGVDSLYTVKKYTENTYSSMNLTHLFIASVNAELWHTKNENLEIWVSEHKTQFDRYKIVSEELALPLVKVYTNYFDYICSRNWNTYHHVYVHSYITMATVLALKKMWKIYYFSSADDFTHFSLNGNAKKDNAIYDLLSMHVLSDGNFRCYCSGASANRIEKTKELADYDLAKRTLHPCQGVGEKNCSKPTCNKCLRALFTLDYYDQLDNMKEVFDIDRYKQNKKDYLWQLAKLRKNEWLCDLYEMMTEKYPEQMKAALDNYESYIKPIPRDDFNIFLKGYDILLKLAVEKNPQKSVLDFFKSKGINKIYCSGFSRLGDLIVKMICDEIVCVTNKEDNIKNCDAAFVLFVGRKDINVQKEKLKKMANKDIYSIEDINKYINEINSII